MFESAPVAQEFFTVLINFLYQFALLLGVVVEVALRWWVLIAWLAWWLLGVNWSRAWPVLARGAWVAAVACVVLVALVWSQLAPSDGAFFGLGTIPNFWWQLGDVCLLAAVALFCGWLQGVFGWTPAEISLEPPVAAAHAHGHDH